MNSLPHPAEETFPLLPFDLTALASMALAVVAFCAAAAFLWWLSQLPEEPFESKPPARRGGGGGIRGQIEALEERVGESRAYREGCHELSALTRSHLERSTGRPVEEMTVSESERACEERWASDTEGVVGFLQELETAQFATRRPTRRVFVDLCERARSVLYGRVATRQQPPEDSG